MSTNKLTSETNMLLKISLAFYPCLEWFDVDLPKTELITLQAEKNISILVSYINP
jgi:hypothetical protein